MDRIEFVRDLVKMRHRRSMSDYLKDGRETSVHVTDLVYGCPRYAKWVYDFRLAVGDDEKSLGERDMTVFVIGKKLDELPVGDYHHVKMCLKHSSGFELVGEIDDLILDEKRKIAVVVDKKHIRSRPPKDAHEHYIRQVNIYATMMKRGASFVSCEVGSLDDLKKAVGKIGLYRIYGAILYIDVSLESSQISDVVCWEITDKDVEDYLFFVNKMLSNMTKEVPAAVLSWFCNYCPYLRRCADVGIGEGDLS